MEFRSRLLKFGGAPRLILSKSPLRRRVWLLIFFCAWAMFVAQTFLVCRRYFSYPKRVSVDLVSEGVPFPSITLCKMRNLNFELMHRMLRDGPQENNEFVTGGNVNHGKYDDVMNSSNSSSIEKFIASWKMFYGQLHHLFAKHRKDIEPSLTYSDWLMLKAELISRSTMLANLGHSLISNVSTQLMEFIVSCQYEREDCNFTSDFAKTFKPHYFNCFTYTTQNHAGEQRDKKYQAKQEGIQDGWSAVVWAGHGVLGELENVFRNAVDWGDLRSTTDGSEGVRVVIHPPGTEAFPFNEGYDVPPGNSVSFALKYKIHERIGAPYGQCTERNPFATLSEGYYRKISCNEMCIQLNILRSCGCVESYLEEIREYCAQNAMNESNELTQEACLEFSRSSTDDESKLCNHISCNARHFVLSTKAFLNKVKCSDAVRSLAYANQSVIADCGCGTPCHQFDYDVSYSLSKWPPTNLEGHRIWMDIFKTKNFSKQFKTKDAHAIYKEYSIKKPANALADFSRINVFLSDGSIAKTVESADYLWFQLLSDIGGQIGIWIGVSVITVSEAFEMAFLIVRDALFGPCKRKNSVRGNNEAGNIGDDGERIDATKKCLQTDAHKKCSQADFQEKLA